ncbi:hypothetical protein JD844_017093 [Phrynosoma platyrhinos]|uniref:Cadherin domain-containing protein n=1 Tax=Phrynosoma platyrhinos TaxID=52577 RepID=A0ABQ7SLD0_PHRPL|nr:hypothetical protein JD844_017093 [Phrynosoma platyrhinos]
MERGSIVGNLAKDLRLNTGETTNNNLHLLSLGKKQYFTISAENGNLYINDRIDREELCGETKSCAISFEVMAENRMNIFHITVEIQDINDNAPHFVHSDIKLEINELTLPGTPFILEQAEDPDIGVNALQDYHINKNNYFALEVREREDGKKYAELVLEKQLDHESESSFHLILTALDGGKPPKTGTAKIWITVIDANDNPPVFTQKMYMVNLRENIPIGSLVVQVKATDRDAGSNGQITYGFRNIPERARQKFNLDSQNGKITVKEALDFEEIEKYVMTAEARDGGGLAAQCNVEIKLLDENDNAPEVILASLTSPIPEDSEAGTLVAFINVNDLDSGDNGKITCHLTNGMPFKIVSTNNDFYKLLTDGPLDRESTPEYNITITATDKGTPPLTTEKTISLKISDVNDNSPAFEKSSYTAFVPENNPSGSSIFCVHASDPDLERNSQITYSLLRSNIQELPLSSYFSINSESGIIYAQRSFDYEQCREFQVEIRTARAFAERDALKQRLVVVVKDNGQPPLSATATLNLVFAENFQEALPEMKDQLRDSEVQSDLQFYLVLALALISFFFLLTVILAIAMKLRRSGNPKFLQCFGPVPHATAGPMFTPNFEDGTLPYSYQFCLSSESQRNEFTFLTPNIQIADSLLCSEKSRVPLTVNSENNLNSQMENIDKSQSTMSRAFIYLKKIVMSTTGKKT